MPLLFWVIPVKDTNSDLLPVGLPAPMGFMVANSILLFKYVIVYGIFVPGSVNEDSAMVVCVLLIELCR